SGLDGASWRARPAPAEWAPVEIVCHLRDEEVEDFGARLRVVLEGGQCFTPIDPERGATERRELADDGPRALAGFRERRAASLTLLAGITPARLTTVVEHPEAAASRAWTFSPPGSSTIACTWHSSPRRWRGVGLRAGCRSTRNTPGRSPTPAAERSSPKTPRADSPASRCPRRLVAARSPA